MDQKHVKKLDKWAILKSVLENRSHNPPFFKEGEIWWCHVGENIGVESSGKNEEFTRPVFIFKKYDKYSFFGLPLTTRQKAGSWYVSIPFDGIMQTIILVQGKTMDYRRLKERVGELDSDDQEEIHSAYSKLHSSLAIIKIDPPQLPAEVVGKSQIQIDDSTMEDSVKPADVDKKSPMEI